MQKIIIELILVDVLLQFRVAVYSIKTDKGCSVMGKKYLINPLVLAEKAPADPQLDTFYVYQDESQNWHYMFKTETMFLQRIIELDNLGQQLISLLQNKEELPKATELEAVYLLLQIKRADEQPVSIQFDYAEHVFIGEAVKELFQRNQTFFREFFPEEFFDKGLIKLENGMLLEVSEFYGLMGDFFGIPGKPISFGKDPSEQKDFFAASFKTFSQCSPEILKKILTIGAIQKYAVHIAMQNCSCQSREICQCPEQALEEVSSLTNKLWNEATGGSYSFYLFEHGDYLKLSQSNVDHFGVNAKETYQAGHELALEYIKKIAEEKKKEAPDFKLIQAWMHHVFALEGSAGHFLTDAFSTGHVRVPRQELYELKTIFGIPVPAVITGLFTLVMHNEDGKNGLMLTNGRGETFKAYGDDALLTGKGAVTFKKVTTAARAGMQEIFSELKKIFHENRNEEKASVIADRSPPTWGGVYDLFPVAKEENNVGNNALFKMQSGKLLRRKDIHDIACTEYIENWWVWTTFLLLLPQIWQYAFGTAASAGVNEEILHDEAMLEQTNNARMMQILSQNDNGPRTAVAFKRIESPTDDVIIHVHQPGFEENYQNNLGATELKILKI
ncbi:hypothetical protein [Legionella septentrionalis]|uniref:hypothetical protein n=1 Tax=Legionella septentrionalis TaxID=2498109 RepID=UPI00131547EB|nr:hypothetical protein [Legionella septentrionalis]